LLELSILVRPLRHTNNTFLKSVDKFLEMKIS